MLFFGGKGDACFMSFRENLQSLLAAGFFRVIYGEVKKQNLAVFCEQLKFIDKKCICVLNKI